MILSDWRTDFHTILTYIKEKFAPKASSLSEYQHICTLRCIIHINDADHIISSMEKQRKMKKPAIQN